VLAKEFPDDVAAYRETLQFTCRERAGAGLPRRGASNVGTIHFRQESGVPGHI